MADDQIRLFSQFGIQQGTEEQMLQQAEKARVQEALALAGQSRPMQPGDEDLSRAGALLGAALKNKFDKPELTPEQKRDLAMKEYATTEIKKKLKDDPEWAAQVEENPQLAGIETMRQMSKYMAFREQQAEIAKYHEEMEDKKATRKRNEETHARDIQDTTQIILPGTNGFSLEKLEEQVVTGRWDPEKEAFVTSEGNEAKNFMTLDEAISLRELGLKAMEEQGVSDVSGLAFDEKMRLFNSAIPASERTGMRMQFDAMDTQSAIMNRTADMFEEFIADGKDPAAFLDGAGKVTTFVTDVAKTVKSLGQTWLVPIKDQDGNILKPGDLAADVPIEIPEHIKRADETGDAAAEYQSAIVQLAYAVARSNEPGARQLSDTDFRNALRELGAAASDPERLRRVIFQNFKRKADQVNRNVQRVGEIGQTVGLSPNDAKDVVYGKSTRQGSLMRFEETLDRYDALTEDLGALRQATDLSDAGVGPVVEEPEQGGTTETPADDGLNYFRPGG
jgi:hypothetical protein